MTDYPTSATKVSVILNRSDDWWEWYDFIKTLAVNKAVWSYLDLEPRLDPDTKKPIPPPDIPEEPEYPEYDVIDGASTYTDVEAKGKANEYKERITRYDRKLDLYKRARAGINAVETAIQETLPRNHRFLIRGVADTREKLLKLQKRFQPTNEKRSAALKNRFYVLGQGPKKAGIQIEKWLQEWENVVSQCEDAKLHELTGSQSIRCFLDSIKGLDRQYAIVRQMAVRKGDPVNIYEEIDDFRDHWMQERSNANSATSFASFNGQSEASNQNSTGANAQIGQSGQSNQTASDPKKKSCPCGRTHKFDKCWYVNEYIRPTDWKPDPEVEKEFEKARRSTTFKYSMDKAIERIKKDQSNKDTSEPKVSFNVRHVSNSIETSTPHHQLQDSWIVDSGSDVHVCNNRSRYIDFRPEEDAIIQFGNTSEKIAGYGTVEVYGRTPQNKPFIARLKNVAYVPGFLTNIISTDLSANRGIYFNQRRMVLEDTDEKPLCKITRLFKQNVLEYNEVKNYTAFAARRSDRPLKSTASADVWHNRLGHPSQKAISLLDKTVEGVEVTPGSEDMCETCNLAKAPQQISRRPVEPAEKNFERLHFDLIQVKEGYNGDRWTNHWVCSRSRWHFIRIRPSKTFIREDTDAIIEYVKTQYNATVKELQSDQEKALGGDHKERYEKRGIVVRFSVRGIPAQNGKAERAGSIIIMRARALAIHARLPESLWPEVYEAAVYVINRTPQQISDTWTSPYEMVYGRKPNLANLRVYGCRAYVRYPDSAIPRTQKLAPRAWIGYLVGYVASNIWRIWNPRTRRITDERDVIFDEARLYDPTQPFLQDIILKEFPELPPELPQFPTIVEEEIPTLLRQDSDSEVEVESANGGVEQPDLQNSDHVMQETRGSMKTPEPDIWPTPDPTPEPITPVQARGVRDTQDEEDTMPGAWVSPQITRQTPTESPELEPELEPEYEEDIDPPQNDHEAQLQADMQASIDRPESLDPINIIEDPLYERPRPRREIRGDFNEDNIVTGKRVRRPNPRYSNFATAQGKEALFQALSIGLREPQSNKQYHRNDLPPPPKNWRELLNHPLKDLILAAADLEYNALQTRNTWKKVGYPAGKQVLPVKWVFTYKFDEEGYLIKAKARICVRGDLQILDREDTAAATLAARTFRTLMAIAAAFDLDMKQFDATNAFINSWLDEEVFIRMPEGYVEEGFVLFLNRALYGLRRSPRLWQKELTSTLIELGMKPVNEDPCLFIGDNIIIMFFVDDLIVLYRHEYEKEATDLITKIKMKYDLRDMGDGERFIGIQITRDRPNRKMWLSQSAYIDKIVDRYNLKSSAKTPRVPHKSEELKPYEKSATLHEIRHYQAKIGSILHPAIISRPDIAKITSKLSEFLTNPGPKHFEAADHVIRYLDGTRSYAMEFAYTANQKEIFFMATDAAFADLVDRKSSQGYLCKLYGGCVDWKAGKQKTVTTSTTEAELLAISEAGKNVFWWKRLFEAIDFELGHDIVIKCDNAQTVRLLTGEDPKIQTKLKHVDIHQLWLRQEVQNQRIQVSWIPTADMPADGLTKLLPAQKHGAFVRMLGLVDRNQTAKIS